MAKIERAVPETMNGARLDKAIVALVEGASRARVKKAIEAGTVRVNGRPMAKGGVVQTGDVIEVDPLAVASHDGPCIPEPEAEIRVVFENDRVLVLDKPAGQPTAPLRPDELHTLAN